MKIKIRTNDNKLVEVDVLKFIKFRNLNALFAIHKDHEVDLKYVLTEVISGLHAGSCDCWSEQETINECIRCFDNFGWTTDNYIEKRKARMVEEDIVPIEINIDVPIRVHYYDWNSKKVTSKTIIYKQNEI